MSVQNNDNACDRCGKPAMYNSTIAMPGHMCTVRADGSSTIEHNCVWSKVYLCADCLRGLWENINNREAT